MTFDSFDAKSPFSSSPFSYRRISDPISAANKLYFLLLEHKVNKMSRRNQDRKVTAKKMQPDQLMQFARRRENRPSIGCNITLHRLVRRDEQTRTDKPGHRGRKMVVSSSPSGRSQIRPDSWWYHAVFCLHGMGDAGLAHVGRDGLDIGLFPRSRTRNADR
jgi:hypothetical protein